MSKKLIKQFRDLNLNPVLKGPNDTNVYYMQKTKGDDFKDYIHVFYIVKNDGHNDENLYLQKSFKDFLLGQSWASGQLARIEQGNM